jgi:hypothetical protein
MSRFQINILSLSLTLILITANAGAQNFSRYEVWTSENCAHASKEKGQTFFRPWLYDTTLNRFKYSIDTTWTVNNVFHSRSSRYSSSINYSDVKFCLNGDFNGDFIDEIALILDDDRDSLRIYTVESRGHRPTINYRDTLWRDTT